MNVFGLNFGKTATESLIAFDEFITKFKDIRSRRSEPEEKLRKIGQFSLSISLRQFGVVYQDRGGYSKDRIDKTLRMFRNSYPSSNLLAAICTSAISFAIPPPPTSIPIGHHPPQICLQTFAPVPFSQPLLLNQPQCRRGTALPKFACRHLHLRHIPRRFTLTNLNTDGVPPPSNLLADICTCAVFPTAPPPPTSIPIGHHPPKICLQPFAPVPFSHPLHLPQPQYR